jgi:CRISPR-associated protein Csb2
MSVTVTFRFLAGRYHATPWDQHPNEGAVEWPPSPWRLLRAIIAAAYKVDATPDQTLLHDVLHSLRMPPVFRLPRAAAAHTRSYQPLYGHGDSTLVLDAFMAIGAGAGDDDALLAVTWPDAQLQPEAATALARWLDGIGYLGRAESWVEAELAGTDTVDPTVSLVAPDALSTPVRLLAPTDVDAATLLAGLTTTTATLQKQRLLEAPTSRWLTYYVPAYDAARDLPQPETRPASGSTRPTIIRLALGGTVLPRFVDTVLIGDRVRDALMSRSDRVLGRQLRVFTGKTEDGTLLRENSHLHVLPQDEDRDGRIDHVLLWAPAGFDSDAISVIQSLRALFGSDTGEVRVAITGMGVAGDDLSAFGVPVAFESHAAVGSSTIWRSRTPFIPMRHAKRRGEEWRDLPQQQVARELQRLGLPEPSMTTYDATHAGRELPWRLFRTVRVKGGGSRGAQAASGWLLTFPHVVEGPIAIGYGARQGLGQFEPA